MYRRLVILSIVVVAAVCGLSGLGYHAVAKWAQGLEGTRLGDFAEVAEQVRQDVKRKLDEFIQAEQQRKYTDYLYYYVPENVAKGQQQQAQLPLLRSPLGNQWSNGFAYGYFQIEADGSIVTPYHPSQLLQTDESSEMAGELKRQLANIEDNVLPSITRRSGALRLPDEQTTQQEEMSKPLILSMQDKEQAPDSDGLQKVKGARSKAYPIESLKQEAKEPQVITQQRVLVTSNRAQVTAPPQRAPVPADEVSAPQTANADMQQAKPVPTPQGQSAREGQTQEADYAYAPPAAQQAAATQMQTQATATVPQDRMDLAPPLSAVQPDSSQGQDLSEMVQIRIEPFVPLVVPGVNPATSFFGGQVFLLRHVQIEDRHLLQGFQLDEHRLVAEVEESAGRFMREGMGFELPQVQKVNGRVDDTTEKAAYTAILDFGFGDLILSLKELDPAWIVKRSGELHRIYLGIIITVVAAVAMALVSLWHNVRAQVRLAAKKDDFISAVSHELRTPLTSIRMYSEMLEKNWVKSKDKLGEYYRNLRQESERLSRLVENVLDFARLQKGRRRYTFQLGHLNDCVAEVVEMMRPYARQHGFDVRTEFGPMSQSAFDKDAVTQIVVNLIDNAVKYAACATEKTITVRTRGENGFAIIEVEDRGPGVPHRQRKKIFEEFYRFEGKSPSKGMEPSQPATTGTGLGLTLVKRFAEAHGGYVEIDSAQPTGAIFRVALATKPHPA
jgi:signal transduction histidine kinase